MGEFLKRKSEHLIVRYVGVTFRRLRRTPAMPSYSRFFDVGWKPWSLSLGWEPSPDVSESSDSCGEYDSGLSGPFACNAFGVGAKPRAFSKRSSMAVRMDTPSLRKLAG